MMMTDLTGVDRTRASGSPRGINSRYHLPSIRSERKTVVPLYSAYYAAHNEAAAARGNAFSRCYTRECNSRRIGMVNHSEKPPAVKAM